VDLKQLTGFFAEHGRYSHELDEGGGRAHGKDAKLELGRQRIETRE